MTRLVQRKDAFYYHDGTTWYRVYDGEFRGGRHLIVKPGSSRQPFRYFVPKNPAAMRRLYKFDAAENRQVTRENLDRQYSKASYFAGPKRTDAHMADWREKIEPDTPDVVAGIRKRNEERAGEPRKRR